MLEENPMSQGGRGGMRTNSRGYSLVELLVVVAIFGVISTVVLDLYVNVVRSTTSSEEVVEVQQGLRTALEEIARDVQMAGFLVQTGIPITVAKNNELTLATGSAFRTFARIEDPATFPAASTATRTIKVGSAAMARLFRTGNYVRIVSPATGVPVGGPLPGIAFLVTGVAPATPSLTLMPIEEPAADIIVANADMIVRVPSTDDDPTYPNVVTYLLEDDPISTTTNMKVLSRIWWAGMPALTATNRDTGDRVLATKISALRFEYLLNGGTVAPDPTAAAGTALTAAQLSQIVGVRIFLTGLGEEGKTRGIKTRELQTTVKIRNI